MSDRDNVMSKVRAALSGGAPDAERRAAVAARLAGRAVHLQPARAKLDHAGQVALFRQYMEAAAATVVEAATADVPAVIAAYLRQHNLPARIRMGADPALAALAWDREPSLQAIKGRAEGGDEVGLSRAVAAVAETGTLVLASGPDNPVTVTFLPETHIVMVAKSAVTGHYEGAWGVVRDRFGTGTMPRTVNFVSGPSRTADIGGKLVLGAHGPRRLCVIIVADG